MDAARVPHVQVLRGGFGRLWATRALAWAPVRVTLVDRTNHRLFQPLLYQVATAGLSTPDIAAPLRHILRKQANVTVRMDEALAISLDARRVTLAQGRWTTTSCWWRPGQPMRISATTPGPSTPRD